LECLRIELGGAASDEDFRARAPAMGMADCLARLAHRLIGDGAAVDDDPVAASGRVSRDRVAFGEVEPAAEGDRLDAHVRASRSSSPSNTCVALPRMRTASPGAQAIVSEPPGMVTFTGEVTRFVLIAATPVAQAPVPHARVRPAPRSQVLRRMAPSSIWATLT